MYKQLGWLDGSCVDNRRTFLQNWVTIDNFSPLPLSAINSEINNVESGKPLTNNPLYWSIAGTITAAVTLHSVVFVTQRKIRVGATGIVML